MDFVNFTLKIDVTSWCYVGFLRFKDKLIQYKQKQNTAKRDCTFFRSPLSRTPTYSYSCIMALSHSDTDVIYEGY